MSKISTAKDFVWQYKLVFISSIVFTALFTTLSVQGDGNSTVGVCISVAGGLVMLTAGLSYAGAFDKEDK